MAAPFWRTNRRVSRRAILRGLGLAAVATPFLPLLNVSGAESIYPKRLVLWFTPHGTYHPLWRPTGTESDFALGSILAPLAAHQSKLNIIDGVGIKADGVGAPHTRGPALLWTASPLLEDQTFERPGDDTPEFRYFGWNSAPSVDQVVAERIGTTTAYRSLEFGQRPGGNHPGSRTIYAAPKQPLAPASDPGSAFDTLFSSFGGAKEQLAILRAEERSVLDLVKDDLARWESRVSVAERPKIEAHLGAVRDVERALSADLLACEAPERSLDLAANDVANASEVIDRHVDLITASLACDLTRVASLQIRVGENDGDTYSFLDMANQHHLSTHAGDSDTAGWQETSKIYTFWAEKFARFLDKLDAIPEGDGTLLDNTMVVWGSELGVGNSHSFDNVPFVVAGGGGGAYPTGRYLQYDGQYHNRLLVAVCQAMGLSHVDQFGKTDQGSGPLAGFLK